MASNGPFAACAETFSRASLWNRSCEGNMADGMVTLTMSPGATRRCRVRVNRLDSTFQLALLAIDELSRPQSDRISAKAGSLFLVALVEFHNNHASWGRSMNGFLLPCRASTRSLRALSSSSGGSSTCHLIKEDSCPSLHLRLEQLFKNSPTIQHVGSSSGLRSTSSRSVTPSSPSYLTAM